MSIAAAGISAGGSILGGILGSSASSSAAKEQEAATNEALAQQAAETRYTDQNLQSFVNNGINGQTLQAQDIDNYNQQVTPYLNQLTSLGNSATAQQALAQTPGYQFTLQQGLQSTQNAAAARGLGVSGAALKGAANYATGLADNTYQQQYNNALTNYQSAAGNWQNQFNSASSLANLGENAAAQVGNNNQQAASANNSLITGAGNAAAAGTVGSANALTSGLTGATGSIGNALLLNQYLGSSGSSANAGMLGSSTYDPND